MGRAADCGQCQEVGVARLASAQDPDGGVSKHICLLSVSQVPVLSSSEERPRGEAKQKRSTTMPPGGGREDPFVLKYLLTITAAAIAETGEGSRGVWCGTGRASLRVGSAQLRFFPCFLCSSPFLLFPSSDLPLRHYQNPPSDSGPVCERMASLQGNAQDSFWNWYVRSG